MSAVAFFDEPPDPDAFEALLAEYFALMFGRLAAAGGPVLDPAQAARGAREKYGPTRDPRARLALAHAADGRLLGTAALDPVSDTAAEMKRLFVRPEAQGTGLGRTFFDMRVAEARRLGVRTLYADTLRGNRPMLRIYEASGFDYVDRYPESSNPPELAPFLVYLRRDL